MIACDIAGVRFNYRVAGVCVEDGHVLLHRIAEMDFWFLPGGRAEVGETSEESLRREMQEELGISVHVDRLLWVVENFFGLGGQSYHELGLYYEITLPAGGPYSARSDVYRGVTEYGDEAVFQWFRLEAIHGIDLVPPFLHEGLHRLPRHTQHLIERR